MYSVLIVDDEMTILNGIAYEIDWSTIYVDNVYTANCVSDAMEYLNRSKIDVVITDIRMPDIDGLELALKVRNQWPFSKVILISGYEEFTYAQTAISLEVFSFVTKPIRNEELKNIVQKALKRIEHDLDKAKKIEISESKLLEVLPILRERFLTSWLVQKRTKFERSKIREFGLHDAEYAVLSMVQIDQYHDKQKNSDSSMFDVMMQNYIHKLLYNNYDKGLSFIDPYGNYVSILFSDKKDDLKKITHYSSEMAETFIRTVKQNIDIVVSYFWSDTYTIDNLPEAYNEIKDRSRKRLLWNQGVVIGPSNGTNCMHNLHDHSKQLNDYPSFEFILEMKDKEKAKNRIDEVISALSINGNFAYEDFLRITHYIFSVILNDSAKHGIMLEDWAGDLQKFFHTAIDIKNIEEFKSMLFAVTERYSDYVSSVDKKVMSKIIVKAKKLINERIRTKVTVAELGTVLHVHPYYLSRIFKTETGVTIQDYIIGQKIKIAKEYIERSEYKFYEIAELVGYESVAHFSRQFKKEVGISPKDFKNSVDK